MKRGSQARRKLLRKFALTKRNHPEQDPHEIAFEVILSFYLLRELLAIKTKRNRDNSEVARAAT